MVNNAFIKLCDKSSVEESARINRRRKSDLSRFKSLSYCVLGISYYYPRIEGVSSGGGGAGRYWCIVVAIQEFSTICLSTYFISTVE